MYIVRRPFKSSGKVFERGSIVKDPTQIKRYKQRIEERYLLEINTTNCVRLSNYFKEKYKVSILENFKKAVAREAKPHVVVSKPVRNTIRSN